MWAFLSLLLTRRRNVIRRLALLMPWGTNFKVGAQRSPCSLNLFFSGLFGLFVCLFFVTGTRETTDTEAIVKEAHAGWILLLWFCRICISDVGKSKPMIWYEAKSKPNGWPPRPASPAAPCHVTVPVCRWLPVKETLSWTQSKLSYNLPCEWVKWPPW